MDVQVAEWLAVLHGSRYPHVRLSEPASDNVANRFTAFRVCDSESDDELQIGCFDGYQSSCAAALPDEL